MPEKKFDLFLSYKSDESDIVERLKDNLVARGVRVWLDKDQIRPGDLFAEALTNGIESSRAVGLVVTSKSMASNWVKNEYYRALGLATQGQLQLIPLLFRDAALPGFLNDRHYVDFRNEAEYERRVDQLIWPGITGKRLHVFAIHYVGSFVWDALQAEVEALGHDTHAADRVEGAHYEVYDALVQGARVVAVVDLFEDWPWQANPHLSPSEYARTIFKIREETKGTRSEVVFVLYQHPDAFEKAPHDLEDSTFERLRHYYMIPKLTNDGRSFMSDAKESMSDTDKEKLHRSFMDAWMKVQRELLRADVRYVAEFETDQLLLSYARMRIRV